MIVVQNLRLPVTFLRRGAGGPFDDAGLDHETRTMQHQWMREAIDLAVENVQAGRGGPFAALVVRDGRILARGTNRVTSTNDPTAHAEIVAIRTACAALGTFWLRECELYASCEPCPMCLGAIYWARLRCVYYAGTRHQAAAAGFDDAHIYDDVARPPGDRQLSIHRVLPEESRRPFDAWDEYEGRVEY